MTRTKLLSTSQELSWLHFNRRVLAQTGRADFPILERLRFLAIWASNLDEFFAARISRPFLEERGKEIYHALLGEARAQTALANEAYRSLLPALEDLGIRVVPVSSLAREELDYFGAYLAEEVAPRTDVIRAEAVREIRNQALYFATGVGVLEHLVRLPEGVPRLLEIPGREGTYVRLGELLRLRGDLFLESREPELHELRVVRLAAIDQLGLDWEDLPAALETRLDGRVSHLEVEDTFPAHWSESIRLALGLEADEVFRIQPPLDLRLVNDIVDRGPARYKYPALQPWRVPKFWKDPFRRIDRGDVMLYHPYQSYEAVEDFARAAAEDAEVTSMRATLYRVGDDNVLAHSLIAAARAGKDVAVLLEARARFDELQNLEWGLRFQNSGVRVLPLPVRKVHAKAVWVRRGKREYLHVGTGNYNTRNARLYTDFSLFTADRSLTRDAKAFFDALEAEKVPRLRHMRTGAAIRSLLVERIRGETHGGGHIIMKFNHMTDPKVLAALTAASRAGARVDLIIRTTLTEVGPGVHARSLVGRFLEHARVAAFSAGGRWLVYAGSLDAMPRNFDRRYELFFPVTDSHAKRAVLAELRAQIADDVNAFDLLPGGTEKVQWGGAINAQRADDHRSALRRSA
ncbi:MAG TPA: polyphosphate kinase [Anaeromyxobacteraceae bacterium]|nr:polyphosphate kinase [Anaeromyxobacteraceae bacterium]